MIQLNILKLINKNCMKIFSYLTNLLIIIVLLFNIVILYYCERNPEILWQDNIYMIFSVILAIESIFIMISIDRIYVAPIKRLELSIMNFLHWWLKDKSIVFEKSLNQNVNFVLQFFSKTLNTLKNIKSEFLHGKQIKTEVELWKEIQEKLLTKKIIKVPSLNIIAKSKPANEIGWDSYDVINADDNYYIYVWDATGHWVWAGFIMMTINALISWFSKIYEKWNDILANTNEIVKPRIKANLLMTLLMVRWNEREQKMYMTWAWHEYLIIYKQKEGKCIKIKSWWVAIWMIKNIYKTLKETEIKFEKHDIIILYSDWITEAINQPKKDWNESMFWEDRLVNSIKEAPNVQQKEFKSAKTVFKNITIELSKFMWYRYTQLDDITLAVIEYKGEDSNILEEHHEDITDDYITEWNWN